MRVFVRMLAVSGMAVLAACGNDERAVDDALRADLSLAAQARPYMQPYVSPQELGYGGMTPYGYPAQYPQPMPYGYQQYPQAPTPVVYQQPAPRIIRQAPAPVVVAAPSGGGGSAGGTGEGRVVTNTKQDAILGATAGAILGAVTSRDRLKGAVIGAAAGGILGGVIGSTIHTKRVP
jgi:hypothetical protein